MHSRIPTCRKTLTAFIFSPDIFFLSLQKTSSFAMPLLLLLAVQIVIVFLPALFNSTNLSAQGLAGIFIVVITIIFVKLTVSTVFIYSVGIVSSASSRQIPFRYCLSTAVMTQWIIVSGKVLAALIGGILVISNPQAQFEIPSFPNVAFPFRLMGVHVPGLLSDIDVFTVWYIVALSQLFYTVMKIRLLFSAICSMVNWSLIIMTQKVIFSLITSSFHRIAQ